MAEAIARAGGAAWAAVRYAAEIERAGPAAGPTAGPRSMSCRRASARTGTSCRSSRAPPVWDASGSRRRRPGADAHRAPRRPGHAPPAADRRGAARRPDATGAGKAEVLARAWGGADVRELPVRRGAPRRRPIWLLDEAAAARLPRSRRRARAVAGCLGRAALPRSPRPAGHRPGRRADRGVLGRRGAAAGPGPRHDRGPPHVARRRPGRWPRGGALHASTGADAATPATDAAAYDIEREFDDLAAVVGAVAADGGPAGRRRGALAGWADRARGEPAHRRDPARRRLRGRAAGAGEEAIDPALEARPARGPRRGRPRRHARPVHDRGHRDARRRPGGVPRGPGLAAPRRRRADDPARARRRRACAGRRPRRARRGRGSRSCSSSVASPARSGRRQALDRRLADGRLEVIEGARHGAHHSHAANSSPASRHSSTPTDPGGRRSCDAGYHRA